MKRTSLFSIICLIAFFAFQPALTAQDTPYQTKTFTVDDNPNVKIKTSGGHIRVQGETGNTVSVEMFVSKDGREYESGEADLSDYNIVMEQRNNTVLIKAERDGNINFGWGDGYSISFKVRTPNKISLNAKTSGGHVDLFNLEGKLIAETSGGHFDFEDLSGQISLETSGGHIKGSLVRGDFRAETSGGHIEINDAEGSVKVETSGGHITLNRIAADQVWAETSGGNIKADILNLDRRMYLDTSGGNITVRLPKRGYDLKLDGSYVDIDGFGEVSGSVEHDEVNGSVLGGGPNIECDTSGGVVKVTAKGAI